MSDLQARLALLPASPIERVGETALPVRTPWATRYVPDREAGPRGGECRVYRSASRRPPPEQEWLNWVASRGSLRVMRTTAYGATLPSGPLQTVMNRLMASRG